MSRRRRKPRGLRAPLVSYAGGGAIVALRPAPSKTHNAHGWSQRAPAADAITHAQATARVLDALRNDARNHLATLDAFGCGESARLVAAIERPLVPFFIAAAERFVDADAIRAPLFKLVSIVRAHGHLLVIAPIALGSSVLSAAVEAYAHVGSFMRGGEQLFDELEQTPAPRIIATRFGVTIETVKGWT